MSLNKPEKKKKRVSFRLNILFFIVFLLFSTLILKLGVLQIVFGQDYKREVQSTSDVTVNNPAPRGKIYDRYGNVIVDNTPLNAITYTKSQSETSQQILAISQKLANTLNIDTSKVTERDKKDYWILKNPDKAQALITKQEWSLYNQQKLSDTQIYDLQLQRIPQNDLDFSQQDLKVLAIYSEINSGYALAPQIIMNQNVTPAEFAYVSENLSKLPGVDTTTDWERKYVYGDTLQSVLGSVSSSQQGLPADQLEQYLAEGYSRNDRVGTSYLEQEYNNVLEGQNEAVKDVTDSAGNVVSTQVVQPGQRGDDIVLTIDMQLQQQVEKIITNDLLATRQLPGCNLLNQAFVVLMNPNTGDVLTMAGKQIVPNPQTGKLEVQDDALGTINSPYNVGSAVKGATVLTGYETGAISPGETQVDEPLNIPGTPLIKSWQTFGRISDLKALQVSSNVYMWKTVIAMAGGHYVPGQPLNLNVTKTFNTLRNSFASFGLGVPTGIDLPNESSGYKGPVGPNTNPGLLLYEGIGQYDTYTCMQLAQYVSTIANGGYRIAPHIVDQIRQPSSNNNKLGPIIDQIQPKILNRIVMPESWIQRVQLGFKMVMQQSPGTIYPYFMGVNYDPAGKSGTAQAFYYQDGSKLNGTQVMNLSMVSYAPANNPQIAMAILIPSVYTTPTGPPLSEEMGRQVMDAYFNLQKQRQQEKQYLPTADNPVPNGGSNQITLPNTTQGQ